MPGQRRGEVALGEEWQGSQAHEPRVVRFVACLDELGLQQGRLVQTSLQDQPAQQGQAGRSAELRHSTGLGPGPQVAGEGEASGGIKPAEEHLGLKELRRQGVGGTAARALRGARGGAGLRRGVRHPSERVVGLAPRAAARVTR